MRIPPTYVVIAIGMMATVGCGQQADSTGARDQAGAPRDLETVREVKKRHDREIRRRYNAIGHGIGTVREFESRPAPEDDAYVIVVHLRTASDKPETPQQIGGVPLRFAVTGTFRAQ